MRQRDRGERGGREREREKQAETETGTEINRQTDREA